jgi:hypothetical protein
MFYADKLYWGDVRGQDPSADNYTLDLDGSSCTTDGNSSSAMYVFLHETQDLHY